MISLCNITSILLVSRLSCCTRNRAITIAENRTLTFQKNCVICLIENPLKMMKNPFYFILKAFFVFKVFVLQFLSRLFGHVRKTD